MSVVDVEAVLGDLHGAVPFGPDTGAFGVKTVCRFRTGGNVGRLHPYRLAQPGDWCTVGRRWMVMRTAGGSPAFGNGVPSASGVGGLLTGSDV